MLVLTACLCIIMLKMKFDVGTCRLSVYHNLLLVLTDCLYGDKVSWCSGYARNAQDCQRPDLKTHCCGTCSRILGSSGSQPSNPGEWLTRMTTQSLAMVRYL